MLDCITRKINLSETLLTSDKLFSENKNSWIGCISAILKFPQIKPHNVLTNQKRKQKYHTPETTGYGIQNFVMVVQIKNMETSLITLRR